jgi:hypothetical protein
LDGPTVLESEADGVSIDWYRGRPIGRLLAAQWNATPTDSSRAAFKILGEGTTITLTATQDGPLFLQINLQPGNRMKAHEALTVSLTTQLQPPASD